MSAFKNAVDVVADVIRRGASPRVLHRYEAERRPVAKRLVGATDAAFERIEHQML